MKVERANVWADAVFHVLAHVDVPFASSSFSSAYCAWAEQKLGKAGARPLAEDVRVLADLARANPGAFATVQALAWVFRSAESVQNAADRELREATVDDETARAVAVGAGPIAEVLRAAAELEMPALAATPQSDFDVTRIAGELETVSAAAPILAECTISLVPALGLRGRVLDRHLFVGMPGMAGAEVEHIQWQAAHEATVQEVSMSDAGKSLPFLELERRAIGLLRSRARRAGLGVEHGRWLAHLDLSELGPIPDVEDAT